MVTYFTVVDVQGAVLARRVTLPGAIEYLEHFENAHEVRFGQSVVWRKSQSVAKDGEK